MLCHTIDNIFLKCHLDLNFISLAMILGQTTPQLFEQGEKSKCFPFQINSEIRTMSQILEGLGL